MPSSAGPPPARRRRALKPRRRARQLAYSHNYHRTNLTPPHQPYTGAQSHRSARAALPDAPRPAVGRAGPASEPAGRVQGVQAVASAADQNIRKSQPSLA
eukprot:scaffold58308_cov68-Phaeocystis_antarctica.AAC.3